MDSEGDYDTELYCYFTSTLKAARTGIGQLKQWN